MAITDEQLQAIARKHYANLSQSDTMDLFQALRERDATIADLRQQWLARSPSDDPNLVDDADRIEAELSRDQHYGAAQLIPRLLRALRDSQAELSELRKPVAAEFNKSVEDFRAHCKQYALTWGGDTHIISPKEVSGLFDAYDALAKNAARYKMMHRVAEDYLNQQIDKTKEAWQRVSQLQENAARDASARDALLAEMRGLRERQDNYQNLIAECYQFAGAVGAPVRFLDALSRPDEPRGELLPVAAAECQEIIDAQERERQLRERVAELEQPNDATLISQREKIYQLQDSERQLREALTLVLPMAKGWAHEHPVGDNQGKVNHAAAALAAWPAPVESERERTPEQYAIEHGRYLATAAKGFMDDCNAVWAAQQAVDDDETDTENEAAGLLNKLDDAKESQSEGWRALENAIYEFTKRADRAWPQEENDNGTV